MDNLSGILLLALYDLMAVLLLGYLLAAKRKLDIFLVGGISAVLFSFPLALGSLAGPPGFPVMPVEPVVYFSFIFLLAMILAAAVLYDRSVWPDRIPWAVPYRSAERSRISFCLATIWILLLAGLLNTYGLNLLIGLSKRQIMDMVSFQFTLFSCLSILVSVWFFFFHNFSGKFFALIVLLTCLAVGQRSPIAIGGIALLLLYGRKWPPVSLALRYPVLTPLALFSAIGAVSLLKPVYGHFKAGGIERVVELFSSYNLFALMAKGSEFMTTQYIFNEIVSRNFSTDGGHIIRGPFSILPFPRELFTTPSSEFNDLFQPELFPGYPSGMAYNSLAEFYTAAGPLGIVVFVAVFIFSLVALAILINRVNWTIAPVVAICGALIAFYSYRNSVAVTAGLIRNIVWPYLLIWVGTLILAVPARLRSGESGQSK